MVFNAKAATDAIAERNDVERVNDKMRVKEKKPKHDKKARAEQQAMARPAESSSTADTEPVPPSITAAEQTQEGPLDEQPAERPAPQPVAGSSNQSEEADTADFSSQAVESEPLPEFADGLPVDVGLDDLSGSLHVAVQAERTAARQAHGEFVPPAREPRQRKKRTKVPLPDPLPDDTTSPLARPSHIPEGFCTQCYVPVADDPDPETMFIYLHALRYETPSLGRWETPLPRWAGEHWQGDWRGWVGEDDQPQKVSEQEG